MRLRTARLTSSISGRLTSKLMVPGAASEVGFTSAVGNVVGVDIGVGMGVAGVLGAGVGVAVGDGVGLDSSTTTTLGVRGVISVQMIAPIARSRPATIPLATKKTRDALFFP